MKQLGLIGGMSWESTQSYYQLINQTVKAKLGGLHSAKLCLYSVDFAEIAELQAAGDWQKMTTILAGAATSLKRAGSDAIVICTNTMHKISDEISAASGLPVLHIADATAKRLKDDGVKRIALLGTRFTMQQDFYKARLQNLHGIEVITPNNDQQALVHDIIYDELCRGEVNASSRQTYLDIIDALHQQGAEGVILGCTEIGLLVQQAHTQVPLYDTTKLHAEAVVEWSLGATSCFIHE
ncbi:aspartate/glutamate racemase family protein [Pseudoalteromonas piscicida]|uniref:Aspartate/glutamate racemase family protein n=1 Tax=Pseudoalteromonas piscicida TaxID=43662 RepID=A0AAQ2EWT0_PSEO7|nr:MULTISPECIES: aspartate/glutamate racemase family protein [Pseudoalteromonas]KJY89417.1 aspartate racemase [Pseudoalteromonas piscicida]TMN34609.1 aspartate/glutamate racemase family protein [Pseudoalteromonas piscicida]TMN38153.1 aspartate/glutamate racemase family protein [Pseudoalteromonas piscicida]TMN47403.1 aspartate/glutamate racemase family protein [Pseudoalteromonas piscicida]TMN47665.1 aspartate/glutamate racemase family protein [Pseudoalteromonas piscicida]